MAAEEQRRGSASVPPGLADLSFQARVWGVAAAATFAVAALATFGLDARGLISAAFAGALPVLAAFDLEHGRIPTRIVLPAIGAILIAQLAFFSGEAVEWVAAGLGAGLIFWLPTLFKAGAVGIGDVKLATLLGVGLGDDVITALLVGTLAAVPLAVWILIRREGSARHETIPLGPFLAIGGLVALFLGDLPGS